jgi:hypothetical protein
LRGIGWAYDGTKEGREARHLASVKAGVDKLGTGEAARVEVRLKDGRKLKGFIGKASGEGFVVVDSMSNAAVTVLYPQVKQVKGHNLSTGAWVGIGAAIASLLLIWLIVAGSD